MTTTISPFVLIYGEVLLAAYGWISRRRATA